MGGKCFNTERLNKDKYNNTLSLFRMALLEHSINIEDIPYFRNKDSFGDIDVITTSEQIGNLGDMWVEILTSTLDKYSSTKTIAKQGGGVKSFLFDGAQVDLIYVPERVYSRTYDMLSWNDLSGFVGILLRSIGIKLSNKKGICVNINKNTNYSLSHTVFIELDLPIDIALELCGLSVTRFRKGFDTLEEIFDYVTDSPLYEYGMFSFENGNNKHRQRNKARGTFKAMLEFCSRYKYSKNVTRKVLTNNDYVIELGKLIGDDTLLDRVYEYGNIAHIKQSVTQIISTTRKQAISDVILLLYPDMDFSNSKDYNKFLGTFYRNNIINSGMSIDEICNNMVEHRLTNIGEGNEL